MAQLPLRHPQSRERRMFDLHLAGFHERLSRLKGSRPRQELLNSHVVAQAEAGSRGLALGRRAVLPCPCARPQVQPVVPLAHAGGLGGSCCCRAWGLPGATHGPQRGRRGEDCGCRSPVDPPGPARDLPRPVL